MKTIQPYSFINPVTGVSQSGRKIVTTENGIVVNEEEFLPVTAEVWLALEGFSTLRLLTLLDAEAKLRALNMASSKVTAVRGWIDSVLSTFVANSEPRTDWQPSPHSFEDTIAEAFELLTKP
jgi:hypothetical protein